MAVYPLPLTEQARKKGYKGDADESYATASHELLDALRFCLCVIKK